MKIDWTKVKEGITTMDVLKEENKEQRKEIERLNNIVNQVEKLAESEYEKYKDKSDVSLNCVALANLKILNKLKELKGSNKE